MTVLLAAGGYAPADEPARKPMGFGTLDVASAESVRAHTEWVQALQALFGEAGERLAPETVFSQLDLRLGSLGR